MQLFLLKVNTHYIFVKSLFYLILITKINFRFLTSQFNFFICEVQVGTNNKSNSQRVKRLLRSLLGGRA